MSGAWCVLALASSIFLAAALARADQAATSINTLLPQQPGKTACFAGRFGDLPLDSVEYLPPATGNGAYSARYKRHRVKGLVLQLEYERTPPLPDSKNYAGYDRRYDFLLSARLAERKGLLYAAGECRWLGHDFQSADGALKIGHTDTALYCGIDCDGGGMTLERIKDKDALRLRIEAKHELRMTRPCDEQDKSVTFAARDAAKNFSLASADHAVCRPLERWIARRR